MSTRSGTSSVEWAWGTELATMSSPTMFKLERQRSIFLTSRVVHPPGSGVPATKAEEKGEKRRVSAPRREGPDRRRGNITYLLEP
jgi:hypothetical protein